MRKSPPSPYSQMEKVIAHSRKKPEPVEKQLVDPGILVRPLWESCTLAVHRLKKLLGGEIEIGGPPGLHLQLQEAVVVLLETIAAGTMMVDRAVHIIRVEAKSNHTSRDELRKKADRYGEVWESFLKKADSLFVEAQRRMEELYALETDLTPRQMHTRARVSKVVSVTRKPTLPTATKKEPAKKVSKRNVLRETEIPLPELIQGYIRNIGRFITLACSSSSSRRFIMKHVTLLIERLAGLQKEMHGNPPIKNAEVWEGEVELGCQHALEAVELFQPRSAKQMQWKEATTQGLLRIKEGIRQ